MFILAYMFYFREKQLVKLITDDETITYSLWAALRARFLLLLFNFGLYIFIIMTLWYTLRNGCVAK